MGDDFEDGLSGLPELREIPETVEDVLLVEDCIDEVGVAAYVVPQCHVNGFRNGA